MAKVGRKTKLTKDWLKIAEDVLSEGDNAIIFTDNELREEINDRLSDGLPESQAKKLRISDTTFESWKRGDLKDHIGLEFLRLYKKALRIQKKNLFNSLQDADEKQWQRYAWIIERKFKEWNLNRVHEISGKDGKPIEFSGIDIIVTNEHTKFDDKGISPAEGQQTANEGD